MSHQFYKMQNEREKNKQIECQLQESLEQTVFYLEIWLKQDDEGQ